MAQPTINVSQFLPLVQPYAPQASYPAMMQALREACVEFCEKTRCWRHMVRINISRQDQPTVAPGYAAIHEFELVTFDGDEELIPIEYADVDLAEFAESGVPRYITQTGPNRISILPFSDGVLDISMFLKPMNGTLYEMSTENVPENVYDTVPEFLLTLHAEVIAHGALSRLLMIPGQPFTDARAAAHYKQEFDRRTERSFNHNVRGQHRARPRTRASWF